MLSDLNLPPISFHRAAADYYVLGRTDPIRALVNHRMVGTLAGTTAYFQNAGHRPVSTHFGIGKISGKLLIHQYVPLDDTAFGNGNYDASGSWDNWGYKTTEINAQTISIEHQDHWGDDTIKGIVPEDVQQASIALQALLLRGTLAEWKAAGITVRDWTKNGPILIAELAKVPFDGRHIITHNDIAGGLKPYCWKPWAKDTVGFPRAKYVAGITTKAATLRYVPPPETFTRAQVDALIATATTELRTANTTLQTTVNTLQTTVNTLRTTNATLQTALNKERAKAIAVADILTAQTTLLRTQG